MPTNTPDAKLTPDQIARLREKLVATRAEVQGSTPTMASSGTPDAGDHMDLTTRADEIEQKGARAERANARLEDIEDALVKIERGEYGLSEESGEPIGFARLSVVPWARLTVKEAEAAEKRR
ncbi:C4-type zinc finger protein, DksA/TraR family [Labilithrix luteola]|uniref:C4-type zinc finger protein, DksA/TraR family n=1 Tax=Labilithrix luteola TaxID=1391654 RepID=A0A0K1PX88_9BACT|nr:TraR/DksA C4-type zinc finger protein [Labilithrix luteola]AKU97739.1 C4-type zinc finger protein, DksA/TraR family [Labilithrix luteola]